MTNAFETSTQTIGESALASIFGTGADSVLMPSVESNNELVETASRVLKNETLDNILDAAKEEVIDKVKEKETTSVIDNKKGAEILDIVVKDISDAEKEEETKIDNTETKGRPKTDKNSMVSYLQNKIEANDFGLPENVEFDASKQSLEDVLNKLSEKELYEVLDSNWKAKEDEIRKETPSEFFESLPESLQYAAKAVALGANEDDLQDIYKALLRVEEVRVLDPNKEDHQAIIAKSYLQATRFGTEDQIAEQIEDWKDAGKLGKKAKEFKPALDDLQKEQVQAQIQVQEEQRKQQDQLAKYYTDNVYKTLEKGELAGVKLDKRFAKEIANNMVTTVQGPFSGQPVNWLGFGLEKAQYTEPDYEAVMMAAWILNDKPAALEALSQRGKNAQAEKDAKLIKLNQGLGKVGGEQVAPTIEPKKIKRINTSNVLKRSIM